jgi:hypothetical protein
MDTDLQEIDFNACGTSPGNPGPSYLSGIARCKPPSTGVSLLYSVNLESGASK